MKRLIVFFCFISLVSLTTINCVKSEIKLKDEPVLYLYVDETPKFKYDYGLESFIYSNLVWPKMFDGEGKVISSFVINKNGYVQDIRIEKSLCPKCDEEVVRVLSLMPIWEPGKLDYITVDVLMYMPIYFQIEK